MTTNGPRTGIPHRVVGEQKVICGNDGEAPAASEPTSRRSSQQTVSARQALPTHGGVDVPRSCRGGVEKGRSGTSMEPYRGSNDGVNVVLRV